MDDSIELRPPSGADAEALGRMHYRAWVEAYTLLLPPAFWGPATEERWVERHRHRYDDPDPTITHRIAVRDGAVVGWSSSGPARENPSAPPVRDRELYSMYVLASEYGSGLAVRLLDAVIDVGAPAELWVFEHNPRARGFYERNGFAPDGARHVFGPDLGSQPEIRMVR